MTRPAADHHPTQDAVREALAIADRRRQLERRREELTADTHRIVLTLTDPPPAGLGYTASEAAKLLNLSKQRLSQLIVDAREAQAPTPLERQSGVVKVMTRRAARDSVVNVMTPQRLGDDAPMTTPESPETALSAPHSPGKPAALDRLNRTERAELRAYFLDLERDRRARARAGRITETPEMTAAAVRQVRAIGKRARRDVDALAQLVVIGQAVEEEVTAAARACVAGEHVTAYSWADVGRALGMPRQNAHRKYAAKGDPA